MTFTVSSVRDMKPEALATAADKMKADNDVFEQKIGDMLNAAEGAHSAWTGAGGDAALDRASAEARSGLEIADKVDAVVAAFYDGAARLGSACGALLRSVDGAESDGFSVHDRDWTVEDTRSESDDEDEKTSRENARKNHEAGIKANLETLISEDEQVGFAIDAAIDETTAMADDVAAGRTFRPPTTLVGMTPEQMQDLINNPDFQKWVQNHPDAAKKLLDQAFDAGLLPKSPFYKAFLKGFWQREALEQAGIDPNKWDPSAGTDANEDNIRSVYNYYGRLFMDHPYMLWAGMANMIGPSFAGGFHDLRMMIDLGDALLWPPQLLPLKNMSQAELEYFESKFLGMQKEIFLDQASQHEAYLHGGIDEIRRMSDAEALDPHPAQAWESIDRGVATSNQAEIRAGNRELLVREQRDIIDDDYQEMKNHHGPVGQAFTYAMTVVGTPSIPDALSFAEVNGVDINTHMPTSLITGVETTITLPNGNIADYDSRWGLIEEDTLEKYLKTVDRGTARDEVSRDFDERMEENRISHKVDDIANRSASIGPTVLGHRLFEIRIPDLW